MRQMKEIWIVVKKGKNLVTKTKMKYSKMKMTKKNLRELKKLMEVKVDIILKKFFHKLEVLNMMTKWAPMKTLWKRCKMSKFKNRCQSNEAFFIIN